MHFSLKPYASSRLLVYWNIHGMTHFVFLQLFLAFWMIYFYIAITPDKFLKSPPEIYKNSKEWLRPINILAFFFSFAMQTTMVILLV